MCEIFGFSSSKEEELNDYLKEFYSHCEEHPHGWGLAILDFINLTFQCNQRASKSSKQCHAWKYSIESNRF